MVIVGLIITDKMIMAYSNGHGNKSFEALLSSTKELLSIWMASVSNNLVTNKHEIRNSSVSERLQIAFGSERFQMSTIPHSPNLIRTPSFYGSKPSVTESPTVLSPANLKGAFHSNYSKPQLLSSF
ncbi:hypothetical protein AB6A40_010352 [Gnathostoma spinigerum]|uniref:Uncharacterized protein n=1 Tax=Gnathostoma spinigerum TaxID=75299 RepID=A0ABD6EV12_9BILA